MVLQPRTPTGNDGRIALSNLPIRTVNAPGPPKVDFRADTRVIEYLLPFPTHVIDHSEWEPIETVANGRTVTLERPRPSQGAFAPNGRIGTEDLDTHATIVRLWSQYDAATPYPEPRELWPLIQQLVSWIRVKARQYWMFHGQSGFGSAYRGSVITQIGKTLEANNFGVYIPSVLVKPLTRKIWQSIKTELSSNMVPPPSETLFCDGLVSTASGDDIKAILQFGVAAEIAITELLLDVACCSPTTKAKRKFSSEGERDSFYEKLEDWPQRLGLRAPNAFHPKPSTKNWVEVLKELYRCRGYVAHRGRLDQGGARKHIAEYMFATNTLLSYCHAERKAAGLDAYSFPVEASPFEQLDSWTDVCLDSASIRPWRGTI